MEISVLIPARGGSKGIPRKNLLNIAGKPLLWYTIEAAKHIIFPANTCHNIYVSTDDEEIKSFALENDVCVIDRPVEYATDTASTESVMEHFTANNPYDILVLIQPTSPLVRPIDITYGLSGVFSGYFDSSMSVTDTYDILLWNININQAVNYNPLNRGRRQDRKSPFVIETGGFFVTTRDQFLNSKCRIGGKIFFVNVPFWTWPQIDSMEDAQMVEKLLR